MKIPTTEKLAKALKALKNPKVPNDMIIKAQEGYYDDYKSPLGAPLKQLVYDITDAGHEEFVTRIISGEFDGQTWEADEWAETPEGKKVLNSIWGKLLGKN